MREYWEIINDAQKIIEAVNKNGNANMTMVAEELKEIKRLNLFAMYICDMVIYKVKQRERQGEIPDHLLDKCQRLAYEAVMSYLNHSEEAACVLFDGVEQQISNVIKNLNDREDCKRLKKREMIKPYSEVIDNAIDVLKGTNTSNGEGIQSLIEEFREIKQNDFLNAYIHDTVIRRIKEWCKYNRQPFFLYKNCHNKACQVISDYLLNSDEANWVLNRGIDKKIDEVIEGEI